jgi:aspartate racemase
VATRTAKSLGLVGGLGVGATAHYYAAIVRALAARSLVPDIVIVHAELERVLALVGAGDAEGLARYLSRLIERLKAAGAEVAAVPAVTPQFCAPQLSEITALPLVDLVEALNSEIAAQGYKRVTLFGTRFVMETGLFGRLQGATLVEASVEETGTIHAAYLRMAECGRAAHADVEALRSIAQRLCREDGVEAIVLAGTDLSLAFDAAEAGFPSLDSTSVHVAAILRRIAPAV